MQRAIAVLAAFGGCVFLGLTASNRIRLRLEVLRELCEAVRRLQLGVLYTNMPVGELLGGCAGRHTGATFHSASERVVGGERLIDAWLCETARSPAKIGVFDCLTERDRQLLNDYFSILGTSGRMAQRESAELMIHELEQNQLEAEDTYTKKGRVYRTMGVLLGAGVAILLL
ncbi:MAG: stage III sporulation protein AB [Clostridia bacterium]